MAEQAEEALEDADAYRTNAVAITSAKNFGSELSKRVLIQIAVSLTSILVTITLWTVSWLVGR